MKVLILKDWASHKKGDTTEITDLAVFEKGVELGVFEESKKTSSAPATTTAPATPPTKKGK